MTAPTLAFCDALGRGNSDGFNPSKSKKTRKEATNLLSEIRDDIPERVPSRERRCIFGLYSGLFKSDAPRCVRRVYADLRFLIDDAALPKH